MLKIIISPAKKMNVQNDLFAFRSRPFFLNDTRRLLAHLITLTPAQLKALWKCNDQILQLNLDRLSSMDLDRDLSPALLTYEGLQYQSMAPAVFTQNQWDYVEHRLFILSGFYGLLRPFDGIVPYRLEMQARLRTDFCTDLYDFWGDRLYRQLLHASPAAEDIVINLASKEYSKAIEPWLLADAKNGASVSMITCLFESELPDGTRKIKATEAKMARGEMVRHLAACGSDDPAIMKEFSGQGYAFDETASTRSEYVFVKPYYRHS